MPLAAGLTIPAPRCELRAAVSPEDWERYHAIRRAVLFEARGKGHEYDPDHPDERAAGNHPMLFLVEGEPVGVVRVDLAPPTALLRRVAIRTDRQRQGHGRALLALAERFAVSRGCTDLVAQADSGAAAFYFRCGFVQDSAGERTGATVRLRKRVEA